MNCYSPVIRSLVSWCFRLNASKGFGFRPYTNLIKMIWMCSNSAVWCHKSVFSRAVLRQRKPPRVCVSCERLGTARGAHTVTDVWLWVHTCGETLRVLHRSECQITVSSAMCFLSCCLSKTTVTSLEDIVICLFLSHTHTHTHTHFRSSNHTSMSND